MKIGLFTVGTGKMAGGALLRAVAINAERLRSRHAMGAQSTSC